MFIDFHPQEAVILWTYSKCTDYEVNGYGDSVWIEESIPSAAVQPNAIAFDVPSEWNYEANTSIRFTPDSDGAWLGKFIDGVWNAFRHDTATHTYLTGSWRQEGISGAFIAIFPIVRPVPRHS